MGKWKNWKFYQEIVQLACIRTRTRIQDSFITKLLFLCAPHTGLQCLYSLFSAFKNVITLRSWKSTDFLGWVEQKEIGSQFFQLHGHKAYIDDRSPKLVWAVNDLSVSSNFLAQRFFCRESISCTTIQKKHTILMYVITTNLRLLLNMQIKHDSITI